MLSDNSTMNCIKVYPVKLPLIKPGDCLAELIARSFKLEDGDIVAICSTVVSKAEGRIAKIKDYKPSEKAKELSKKLNMEAEFVQAVLEESEEILIEEPFLLVKAKFGNICVNAGIDKSNVEAGKILLPPKDPDKSARTIKEKLEKITGKRVGVIITDTNGRCFRKGVVGFAIGVAGIKAMRRWIGQTDLFKNRLQKTVECVVDEIAAFANLVMGEGDWGIPVVVFRGLKDLLGEGSIKDVYRDEKEDIIRKSLKILKNNKCI